MEKDPFKEQPSVRDRAAMVISGWLGSLRRGFSSSDLRQDAYSNNRERIGLSPAEREVEPETAPTTYQRPDTRSAPGDRVDKESGVELMQKVFKDSPEDFIAVDIPVELEPSDIEAARDLPQEDYEALGMAGGDLAKGVSEFPKRGRISDSRKNVEEIEQKLHAEHRQTYG